MNFETIDLRLMPWLQDPDVRFWVPWISGAAAGVVSVLVLSAVRWLILRRLAPHAARSPQMWDDVVVDLTRRTRRLFIWSLGLALAAAVWPLSERVTGAIDHAVLFVIAVQAGIWGSGVVDYLVFGMVQRSGHANDPTYRTARNMMRTIGLTVVWAAVVLIVLDNLGVEVNTLIAGLGVSSAVIVLASQNIARDIFSSLSIVIDQPFLVGDAVVIGDLAGTVERIGIKTTRIRSVNGEELVFSNSDLIASRIQNFRTLKERRVVLNVTLRNDVDAHQLAQVVPLIRDAITKAADTRFDRAHLSSMANGVLHYEVVYYVVSSNYVTFMDRQQEVLISLWHGLRAANMTWAMPSQTVFCHLEGKTTAAAKSTGNAVIEARA